MMALINKRPSRPKKDALWRKRLIVLCIKLYTIYLTYSLILNI